MKFIIFILTITLLSCGGSQRGSFDSCSCDIEYDQFNLILIDAFTKNRYKIVHSPFNIGPSGYKNEYSIQISEVKDSDYTFRLNLSTVGIIEPFETKLLLLSGAKLGELMKQAGTMTWSEKRIAKKYFRVVIDDLNTYFKEKGYAYRCK